MEFPSLPVEFSTEARDRIIKAEIRASRDFRDRLPAKDALQGHWSNNPVLLEMTARVGAYIITVWAAFARECRAFRKEPSAWDAATVSRESRKFLTLTALYALEKYGYLKLPLPRLIQDGQITAEAWAFFESSALWKEHEDELLEIDKPEQADARGLTTDESNHLETGSAVNRTKGNGLDPVAADRAALLSSFKAEGRAIGIRITDKMVAEASNPGKWNDRTMVTWWKRNDEKSPPQHDRRIRNLLSKDPASIWEPKPKRQLK